MLYIITQRGHTKKPLSGLLLALQDSVSLQENYYATVLKVDEGLCTSDSSVFVE